MFLMHPLSIGYEPIDIPVPGRRKIEFPILIGSFSAEKELKTGIPPKSVFTAWHICRRRDQKVRNGAMTCIADGKCIGTPGGFAGDL